MTWDTLTPLLALGMVTLGALLVGAIGWILGYSAGIRAGRPRPTVVDVREWERTGGVKWPRPDPPPPPPAGTDPGYPRR